MRSKRELAGYVALVVVVSCVFAALMWRPVLAVGTIAARRSLPLAPVVAAMLCSRGHSIRRKAVYALATVAAFVLLGMTGAVVGLEARAAELGRMDAAPSMGLSAYLAALTTLPFASLALFVGRDPSRLWRRTSR